MPHLSIRAYARHRAERGLPGTTHKAVQKALERQRIRLTPEGRIDSDEADQLWAANTDEGHRRNPAQEPARAPAVATKPTPVAPARPPPPDEPPDLGGPPDFAESRARREAAEAGLAELKLALEEEKVVLAADVEARLADVFASCKTKLLGVPARARQRDPTLTPAHLALIEEQIREALEDLAGGAP